ncbi:hypothetical protein DL95DRAFT_519958 [Leptodontidium sp. 2 PMI_412]|nr:hypothetical protein DL95DRAFT_519958 [Leptodontidium sp. 2 PMI_412]
MDNLQSRAIYEGSWALAVPGSACPEDASVSCTDSSISTMGCCPAGDTCFGSGGYYCCPSKDDCRTTVDNFPTCFNSTWSLYQASSSSYYFCCPPGQYGVIPKGGWGGICQYNEVPVATSKVATLVDQLTTSPTTRATRTATITSTRSGGVEVTVTQLVSGQITTPAGESPTGGTIQVPSGNDNANENTSGSSTSGSTSSSKQSLSSGAIAGIVIGSFGVLALFLVAFMLYRRNSKKGNSQGLGGPSGGAVEGHTGGMQQESALGYSAVPQNQDNYPIPVSEFKSPALSAASPIPTGYSQNQPHGTELPSPADGRPGVYEAPVPQSWEGRAEMGSTRW